MSWIKMRVELQTHPKVVRILSAMRPQSVRQPTDKFWVIGGLHAVWCVFDTHSEDGILVGYTPDTLDHIIGLPGISDAMMAVGWLVYDGVETLTLPEFDEHNSQSAKRRAEDQKRKKVARKSAICPQSVRNLSANAEDISQKNCGPEKEKEKEISLPSVKNKTRAEKFDALSHLELLGVDAKIASDWLTLRKAKRAAPTETAIDGIASEARKAGISLQAALKTACERGWQGFKAEWLLSSVSAPPSWQADNARTIAALTGRDLGRDHDENERTIDV